MKPIVYALAYRMGYPHPLFFGCPARGFIQSTGKSGKGQRLEGLARSLNSISLRIHRFVLETGGLEQYQQWGKDIGLSEPLQGYTSEVLGTEQTLWDMVHVFGLLSRAGRERTLPLIRSIEDSEGKQIFGVHHPMDPTVTLPELLVASNARSQSQKSSAQIRAAYIAAANLAEVTRSGTGRKARRELDFETAGKTGTLPYDVWFVGWSPEFLGGAWVGADRRNRVLGRSEKKNIVHGGNTALPIWIDWMKGAQPSSTRSPLLPNPAATLEFPKIDLESGWLDPESGVEIPHRAGTIPTRIRPSSADEGPEEKLPEPGLEIPEAPGSQNAEDTTPPATEENVPVPAEDPGTPPLPPRPSTPESLDDILD